MPVFTLLTTENIQNALRLAKFGKKMDLAAQTDIATPKCTTGPGKSV
jgi:hypothetical protein